MPRNGSGVQSSPGASYPAVASTLIESTKFNAVIDDINSAITASIAADGQTTITSDLPLNAHKLTGVSNGANRTDSIALGQVQDGTINWVDAAGTADAITVNFSPAITALVDGQICFIRASTNNLTTTPTFSPNGLTARTIVMNGNQALEAGSIRANGHELILRYNLANTKWELLNPKELTVGAQTIAGIKTFSSNILGNLTGNVTGNVTGNADTATSTSNLNNTAYEKLPAGTCTQAGGALTFVMPACRYDFRDTTLTSGAVTQVSGTPADLVLPSGGTLGSVTTVSARIVRLLINNAGTMEQAIVNISGGNDLSETGVISTDPIAQTCTFTGSIAVTTGILTLTTPLSGTFALGQALSGTSVTSGTYVKALLTGTLGAAGSTYSTNQITAAASTTITGVAGIGFYSTTARTGVAYRVVGVVDAVNTAGAWGNPTLVQGAGGNALTAMSSLGYGQTWQTVTRTSGTTYYNTTGKPIIAAFGYSGNPTISLSFSINGIVVSSVVNNNNTGGAIGTVRGEIPPGASYVLTVTIGSISFASELR